VYVYRECLKHNYRVSIMKRAQYWQCWGSMHSTQMWGAHISVFFISNVVSRNSMVFLRSLLKTRKESYVKGSILNFIWEILTLILFLVKFKKCWFILFGNRGMIFLVKIMYWNFECEKSKLSWRSNKYHLFIFFFSASWFQKQLKK
jgi:hypothetical protein